MDLNSKINYITSSV